MANMKPPSLSYEVFFAKYAEEIYAEPIAEPSFPPLLPPRFLKHQLRNIWELRAAALAARHNSPDAFGFLVRRFLREYLSIEAPEGSTFKPLSKPRRGRRSDPEAWNVYVRWLSLDMPSLTKKALAESYYGSAYKSADLIERKRMIDRLRRTVERFNDRSSRRNS
jgi:hypothetical protein